MPNISHFDAMILFAAAASAVLAFLSRPTHHERLLNALKTFLTFVGGAIFIAWVLYFLSR